MARRPRRPARRSRWTSSREAAEAVRADPAFQAGARAAGHRRSRRSSTSRPGRSATGTPDGARGPAARLDAVLDRERPGRQPLRPSARGLHAIVDLQTMEVLRGRGPRRHARFRRRPGTTRPTDIGGFRTDLKPLEIVQPEGPSFEVDGWEVRWQKWRFRVGFTQREGLVLHTIGYEDGGRVRPIAHRASIAELVIPYGDPEPGRLPQERVRHRRVRPRAADRTRSSSAATASARSATSTSTLADVATARSSTITNAICLHEEDAGLLWKHHDWRPGDARSAARGGSSSPRSPRSTTTSTPSTGHLYQDGSIEFEVKLTGIVLTAALEPGERAAPRHARRPAAVRRSYHQHFFCARLDLDVDGAATTPSRGAHASRCPAAREPARQRFRHSVETPLRDRARGAAADRPAQRRASGGSSNPQRPNALGQPVGLQARPRARTSCRSPSPTRASRRRAGFMTQHLWVTPFAPDERYPAGDYPNQHAGRRRAARLDRRRPADREHGRRPLVRVRQPPRRRAPRTGRSCRSCESASSSSRSASSTATPRSTCRHRRPTPVTEDARL